MPAGEDVRATDLADLIHDTLLMTAGGLGLRRALQLRSELRALGPPSGALLFVASESGRAAGQLLVADLLGCPRLAATMASLPRVHTTYRFGPSPRLVLSSSAGERTLLPDDTRECELGDVGDTRELLQIDVCVPSPFLAHMGAVHLPDLHRPSQTPDLVPVLAEGSGVIYVASGRVPLAAVEIGYLRQISGPGGWIVVVVTQTDAIATWHDVARVDEELLEAGGVKAEVVGAGQLRMVLAQSTHSADGGRSQSLALIAAAADAVQARAERPPIAERGRKRLAGELGAAESRVAEVGREAMSWLPRLSHEFTKLRTELGDAMTDSLSRIEQRYDQWIQSDVNDAIERMPVCLVEDLRSLEHQTDGRMTDRLDAMAHTFLGGRPQEFLPGGMRHHVAGTSGEFSLVAVAQVHSDPRTEFFASLGNFGSGRQSLSLVGSIAASAAAPAALVGGIVGLGFWRVGRQTRQEGLARVQAGKWLKVQLAASNRMRNRIDQVLNDAQLVMNLAVREYHDMAALEARHSVEALRQQMVEADDAIRKAVDRAASMAERARLLQQRVQRDSSRPA